MVRLVPIPVALALLLSLAVPAAASAVTPERALSADEAAAAERRITAAEAYLRSQARGRLGPRVAAGCPTPTTTGGATTAACGTPSGFLGVEARDQVFNHYCGPAVGQVIANYAWAVGAGKDRYTQGKIAGWMKTDVNGLTSAPELEDGLEASTAGAPRRPAGWDWVVMDLRDRNGDGDTADELHGYLRSNVSGSRMPLAISVKPHDPAGAFHLSSWSRPVQSVGHWIAAYGWWSVYTKGSDASRLYYTDSSRDEGGSTGKFWDPVRHVASMVMAHTKRIVW